MYQTRIMYITYVEIISYLLISPPYHFLEVAQCSKWIAFAQLPGSGSSLLPRTMFLFCYNGLCKKITTSNNQQFNSNFRLDPHSPSRSNSDSPSSPLRGCAQCSCSLPKCSFLLPQLQLWTWMERPKTVTCSHQLGKVDFLWLPTRWLLRRDNVLPLPCNHITQHNTQHTPHH